MAEPVAQKTFRLPWALSKRLEETAQETGKTQLEIVISALETYLQKED